MHSIIKHGKNCITAKRQFFFLVEESSPFQEKKYSIPSKVIDLQAFHKKRRSAQLFSCLKEGNGAIIIFYSEFKKKKKRNDIILQGEA